MNLKQLEFAIAVAEEGNFTRAAERCNVVQSALSHQIARLEEELGTRLFERRPRQVLVTAAGEALLDQARLAVEATRRIPAVVAAVAGEVRGSLTVGMISSLDLFDIVELLAAFHVRFAQIDIGLRQEHSEILLEAVSKRSIDLAFIGVSASTLLEGVEKRLLAEEELVAVLPPATRWRAVSVCNSRRSSICRWSTFLPAAAPANRPTRPSLPSACPTGFASRSATLT